jgi:hypothetical protein
MPEPRRRRFTLADAMILVAATALGLFLIRIAASLGLFEVDGGLFEVNQDDPFTTSLLEVVTLGGACMLLPLALAVLILTARQPRRERRHAALGPGFVVCLLVMPASVLPITQFARNVLESSGFRVPFRYIYFELFHDLLTSMGVMIIGAWFALLFVGRWRPRPTWTDRLGLVVGACWVFLYGSSQLYQIVVPPLLRWWHG